MSTPESTTSTASRPTRRRKAGGARKSGVARKTPESSESVPETQGVGAPGGSSFPVVGIGASAGGLETLEQFLGKVPADCGMAFVIVQHLDPTHVGIMPELLQRGTGMKVMQVLDRTRVQPGTVYVIPPNRDMLIRFGVLRLLEPAAPRGLRLPIDFFLRSLAQDQRERSIGVILSGMGSDGTLGLRAIKEQGGVVLVQDPSTAKFDGMPRSAVDAGLADIVAPVEELPGRIVEYLRRTPVIEASVVGIEEKAQSGLEKAIILLRAHTGQDFSLYKRNTLCRRIERRMAIHQIGTMADYVQHLRDNPQELDLLFKELLIGVTNFFRDPAVWSDLYEEAIQPLLENRTPGHVMRVWVPGCSTGEEAYSLAMLFREAIKAARSQGNHMVQIFATDLDRDAIDRARRGLYPENIAADVTPERLARYFVREDLGYRVRKEIRETVIFAPQNLVMDPPFTKLDLLSCRNLLIYLTSDVQKKLIPLFHYSLSPGGILLLGSAETVGSGTGLFSVVNSKARIYRRKESGARPDPVEFPSSFGVWPSGAAEAKPEPQVPASLQTLADRMILSRYAPPAVLVSDRGDILYISGRTGKYLEPAAGKANWNLFAMVRESLRLELAPAFHAALSQRDAVVLRGLRIGTEVGIQYLDVTVQRLEESGPLQGLVMIVFTDVPAPEVLPKSGGSSRSQPRERRLAELELELQQVRSVTRTNQEEMQTSREEFRSANEELQSTNEELQSTNEELTTSKEEMQSLNEELQTVNAELQAKVEELSRASDDMKNLLDSTDIATLFLDRNLKVRRFTAQATNIIRLIPADAGRPVTDLTTALNYPELATDAHEVLRKSVVMEKSVSASDGRWFMVRIMPYRTVDDRIDGVVITFADITAAKMLEAKLRGRSGTGKVATVVRGAKRVTGGGFGSGVESSASKPRKAASERKPKKT